MKNEGTVWIAWERQRRSVELARLLGVKIYILRTRFENTRLLRYGVLSARTLLLLARTRPAHVFAQNPSIVLAAVVCLAKTLFGYSLIVDRHSNFKLNKRTGLQWRAFHALSRYTVRKANLTVVTNGALSALVDEWGGRGFVLQDTLPRLQLAKPVTLGGRRNVIVVATYAEDEPIEEVLAAARLLDPEIRVHVTGDCRKYLRRRSTGPALPENVRLTGYLQEKDYQSLLLSADVIVVLTREENLLTCGAYEAASLGKAMVLSDTEAIRGYFRKGALYVKPVAESIAGGIRAAIEEQDTLSRNVREFRAELTDEWNRRFEEFKQVVYSTRDQSRPSLGHA